MTGPVGADRLLKGCSRANPRPLAAYFSASCSSSNWLAGTRKPRSCPTPEEYTARFPELAGVVAVLFDQTSALTPKSDRRGPGTRFKAGEMIAGRYRIVSRLGQGGMGEVYQVEDEALQQTVARSSFFPPNVPRGSGLGGPAQARSDARSQRKPPTRLPGSRLPGSQRRRYAAVVPRDGLRGRGQSSHASEPAPHRAASHRRT